MAHDKVLVLIHGFLGGSDYWHKQSCFSDYADVIKVQLTGYGNRADEKVCDSIETFAQSVIAQVDEKTDATFDLMGHSMGGMIAQEVVKQNPDRVNKLILFGTGPIGDIPTRFEKISISLEKAQESTYHKGMAEAVASWFVEYEQDEDYDEAVALAKRTGYEAYLGGLHAMQKWNGIANLQNIKQNTLILWGETDRTYEMSQQQLLHENIPNSKVIGIPNAAHNTHLEKPEEFNAIVKAFLYSV